MDLDNPLDQIDEAQAQKATTANELIDAVSVAALYGRRASTSSGLTWGYYGGRADSTLIAHGTVALTASDVNYIVADKSTGAVSVSTVITNWNDSTNYSRLYLVTTDGSGPDPGNPWEDHRQVLGASGGGGGGATAFTALTDVPASYSGESLKGVRVNAGETALEFETLLSEFTELGDVPSSYSGHTLKAVRVNAGETALEFYTPSSGSVATDAIWDTKGDLAVATGANTASKLVATTNGFVLTLDSGEATGMKWAPGGSGTPAGSNTEIQYNNSSAFGASSKFTWNDTTRTLSVNHGTDGTAAVIQCPAQATANTAGQGLTVRAAAGLGSGAGGPLSLTAGAGGATNATGGGITITAGASGGTTANGGGITMVGGVGGTASSALGGAFTLTSGAGHIGGGMLFTTGATSQAGVAGGNFRFVVGAPGAGGVYGQIRYERDDTTRLATWHGTAGNLNLGPTTSNPNIRLNVEGSYSCTSTAQNATTTTTINLQTTNVHKIAMIANITTLTVSNPTDNQEITILFTQDGGGSKTIAWPAAFKWAAGATPTLSTPGGSVDMYQGIYNSTTGFYYGRLEKAFA
jgi:hypothetical protein